MEDIPTLHSYGTYATFWDIFTKIYSKRKYFDPHHQQATFQRAKIYQYVYPVINPFCQLHNTTVSTLIFHTISHLALIRIFSR